ncbi:MAG: hypothetical protein IKF49_06915 [Clostridia bacterium]|nr:hypothetical protein [Clostridia bacterium]
MADDTRIYVDKQTFANQVSELDSRLNALNNLLREYEAKKEEARRVWGDEDENQRKAIALCESAIAVVQQKIDATKVNKEQLQNVSDEAFASQAEMGAALDESKSQIDALLQ